MCRSIISTIVDILHPVKLKENKATTKKKREMSGGDKIEVNSLNHSVQKVNPSNLVKGMNGFALLPRQFTIPHKL